MENGAGVCNFTFKQEFKDTSMTRTTSMLRRTFLATIAMLGLATVANAGTVSLYLIVDPASTAFAGVSAVAGQTTSSTRSGAGTWQAYAVDEATGSFGLAQVQLALNGTVPAINNRLTQTQYDTADDSGFKAGMTLLRSNTNVNPVFASAELPGSQPFTQGNLGITAGNYNSIPGATAFSGTTNGQWGVYSAANAAMVGTNGKTSGPTASGNVRNALLVAEGTYTGAAPTINLAGSFAVYYTNAALNLSTQSNPTSNNPLLGTNPFVPEPATMTLVGLAVVGFGGLVGRRRS
jgi:hypothetical protein